MAVTTGTRTGVTLWSAGTDPLTRAQMTASHQAIEDKMALHLTGLLAARPAAAAGNNGAFYFATDTGDLYRSDGTTWVKVMLPGDVVDTEVLVYGFPGDVKATVAAASGEPNSIPIIPIELATGQAKSIVGYWWTLAAGTSFTFSVEHYTDATHSTLSTLVSGVVAAAASKKGSNTFTPKVCADGDGWRPKITGISGTPNAGAVGIITVTTV